ncbi:hypothetical protein Q5P01_014498 [Channa striata]|uniref:Ubiquitin-like domain-containing protein n=1 Tax=Channa striata TaxID=64152 RepID=A0AA88MFJ6_CHASR|nr:hypothetical protein Q5P01_014498 [Channa striata]
MDITITMLDGTAHTLVVDPDKTVGDLKKLIHVKFGVAPNTQRLMFVNGQTVTLSEDTRKIHPSFQVFVRNDKGKTNTYDTSPDETVHKFKSRVEHREGVAVSQQRLVFQGREMMDGTLSDYGVKEHSTIDLCLRLRGG